jgi:hypothetical protein
MNEKLDAEAIFIKYENVQTSVVYWDSTPTVLLGSLRSAAKHLKEHPSNAAPVELHVHVPPDIIITGHELKAVLDAV